MQGKTKQQILKQHKAMATILLLIMAVIFVATVLLQKKYDLPWLGYVQAFAEAAMVGALADWFAVSALFNYPMGLPIPHTNLIENSKKRIGDNLGNFVVDNFLQPSTIRPYINKIAVAPLAAEWLSVEKNRTLLTVEASFLIKDILQKLKDEEVAEVLASKGADILKALPVHSMLSNVIDYVLKHNEHEALVTTLSGKIKLLIRENEGLVQEKVQQESFFFIPGFVDRKLASKITSGLEAYFSEIEQDPQHRVRKEIDEELQKFSQALLEDPSWKLKLEELLSKFVTKENLASFALEAWINIKAALLQELSVKGSVVEKYLQSSLADLSIKLKEDEGFSQKIDGWIRHTAYRLILKNKKEAGTLISNTVGNWEGRALSEKLELEVGKDLQFIRINGTIVGGLVGLLLYIISHIL